MSAVNSKRSWGSAPNEALAAIRQMILLQELSPGQQLRQTELAERMGLSRVPIREALKLLEAEGAIVHHPNQGYFVAKLSQDDLRQIYAIRDLLEDELLRSIVWPSAAEIDVAEKTNEKVAAAARRGDITEIAAANRRFHFVFFGWSPLNRFQEEVERMWRLCEPYQALYLYDAQSQLRIVDEHSLMIEAARKGNHDKLIAIAAAHRHAAAEFVDKRLEPFRRFAAD